MNSRAVGPVPPPVPPHGRSRIRRIGFDLDECDPSLSVSALTAVILYCPTAGAVGLVS